MPLQDVTVSIDIKKPSALIGLGVPLILAEDDKATEASYKEYFSLEDLLVDFTAEKAVYRYASKVFNQSNRPAKVAVAVFNKKAVKPILAVQVLEQFFYNDFYFVMVADGTKEDKLAVSDLVEANGVKIAVHTVGLETDVEAFNTKKYDRTVVFFHNEVTEVPSAGLIGAVGSRPVGSVTWKFKTIAGVTPQDLSGGKLQSLHKKGAVAYVTKAGINQTSEGIVVSGEYIDVIHGKDWVRLNLEQQIQKLLSTSDKVPFTDAGIAQIESVVTNVMETAVSNGIIARDADGLPLYTISALSRSQVSQADRAERRYNGLSFSFELAGAIHEASIQGEILI
ncbi:DUF3383 family protein [Sporosarcina sp. P17b]|uniref:DUF3383 family protein n=1 Tax=Sporosarcina sp. P17b TaxID=2048260 RepID=UPI000C17006F|nr:DUF3383 family protein [Sporosarcina sp. P17b]PIC73341.1 hypothetical protein CSV76_11020 [Sporosarcina sp. P17b]